MPAPRRVRIALGFFCDELLERLGRLGFEALLDARFHRSIPGNLWPERKDADRALRRLRRELLRIRKSAVTPDLERIFGDPPHE